MTIEIGVGLALAGVVFGWGASWATLGQKITSLKETTSEAFQVNERTHEKLLKKLEEMNPISMRVAMLEMKVFGKINAESKSDV